MACRQKLKLVLHLQGPGGSALGMAGLLSSRPGLRPPDPRLQLLRFGFFQVSPARAIRQGRARPLAWVQVPVSRRWRERWAGPVRLPRPFGFRSCLFSRRRSGLLAELADSRTAMRKQGLERPGSPSHRASHRDCVGLSLRFFLSFGHERLAAEARKKCQFLLLPIFFNQHPINADAEQLDASQFFALSEQAGLAVGRLQKSIFAGDAEKSHGLGPDDRPKNFTLINPLNTRADRGREV